MLQRRKLCQFPTIDWEARWIYIPKWRGVIKSRKFCVKKNWWRGHHKNIFTSAGPLNFLVHLAMTWSNGHLNPGSAILNSKNIWKHRCFTPSSLTATNTLSSQSFPQISGNVPDTGEFENTVHLWQTFAGYNLLDSYLDVGLLVNFKRPRMKTFYRHSSKLWLVFLFIKIKTWR